MSVEILRNRERMGIRRKFLKNYQQDFLFPLERDEMHKKGLNE